jgi:serine/threonine protein kinase/tetratricopeptide (TPR) repeat protein
MGEASAISAGLGAKKPGPSTPGDAVSHSGYHVGSGILASSRSRHDTAGPDDGEDVSTDGEPTVETVPARAGGPLLPQVRTPEAPPPGEAPRLPRGTCVDRYVVVDHVASGGMASVYRAFDPDLNRQVALKLVAGRGTSNEKGDPDRHVDDEVAGVRERLLREAQGLARLSHPNVVPIYDVGVVGGDVFLAMELIEGKTLRAWLREGHSRRETLAVVIAAGEGLAAAHHAGLVHRDFKPDNVLIGNDGRVRVVDFGLVKPATSEGATEDLGTASWDHPLGETISQTPSVPTAWVSGAHAEPTGNRLTSPLTQAGTIMGTPSYMAPEQHLGRRTDPATDQFAFCVTLYEALYRRRPFDGKSARIYRANVCEGRVTPAPAKSHVPARLRRILLRGLAVRREDRFPSMTVLLGELRKDPRRRLRLAALAAVMVALAGLSVFGLTRSRRPPVPVCAGAGDRLGGLWSDERRRAVKTAFGESGRPDAAATADRFDAVISRFGRDLSAMRVDVCEATHVRGEQSEALLDRRMRCLDQKRARVAGLVDLAAGRPDGEMVDRIVPAALTLTSLAGCGPSEVAAAVPLPDDPTTRARIDALGAMVARAEALEEAGAYADALALVTKALPEIEGLGYAPLHAAALTRRGSLEDKRGDYDQALATLTKALPIAGASRDPRQITEVWILQIWVLGIHLKQTASALALEPSAQVAVQLADDDVLLGARVTERIALVHLYGGDYDQSLAYLERTLAAKQRVLPEGDMGIVETLNNLGAVRFKLNHLAAAQADFTRALAVYERVLGPRHPEVAAILYNLGHIYSVRGDDAAAEQVLRRAATIETERLGANHPDLAPTLGMLGRVLARRGRFAEAHEALGRTLVILEAAYGPGHAATVTAHVDLGGVYLFEGDTERAEVEVRRALGIAEQAFGPNDPRLSGPLTKLGDIERKRGRFAPAAERYQRAVRLLDDAKRTLGLWPALVGLAACHLELKRPADAVAPLERALTLLDAAEATQGLVAEPAFLLTQALWASKGDPVRARELARRAKAGYEAGGDPAGARAVAAWLGAHPP